MLEELSVPAWLSGFAPKTENGKDLDLRSHLFLYDIYADLRPKQVIMKAAQVGMSTAQILKTIWMAKHQGLSVAYTLPTYGDAQEFVRTKANRLIQMNPELRGYMEEGDNISDKRIGNATIFYRGSFAEKQAISFTADLLCFDEVDRSDQRVLATYASRLQHSEYKGEWYFSNPSVKGNGVSRFWEESDQKHWFIKCGAGHEQYLSWPDSVNQELEAYVCKKCGRVLTDEQRRRGRWVARWKDKDFSGYWISLLMAPWVTAKEIIKYHREKSVEYFHNFVLGLPYIGEGNTVTPDMIYRNCTGLVNSQEQVVIGCDSGIKKHYVLGNKEGLFYYGVTETWEAIESLLARYPKSIAVIDALPDLTEPRKLREKYPGRIFLCHYAKDRKTFQFVRWGENAETGNVNVDRNRMMQMVIDEFADGRIPLQGTRDDWGEFYQHFESLYRLEEKDAQGNPFFKWETSNGTDHWAHATLYWRVGMSKYGGDKPIITPGRQEQPGYHVEYGGISYQPDPMKLIAARKGKDWRT
jgi:hypothetical protein